MGDTTRLDVQTAQQYMHALVDMSVDFTELSAAGYAWTAEVDDRVLAVAGLLPQWENRALAWALISESAGTHFAAIHKAVHRFISAAKFRRIEATVDVGFKQGCRWIELLGFEIEGYMRAYRPDGADMLLYARVVR